MPTYKEMQGKENAYELQFSVWLTEDKGYELGTSKRPYFNEGTFAEFWKALKIEKEIKNVKKREILAQIVNRKYLIKKTIYMNGKQCNYFTEPDHMTIIKAIELDNRMAGDFADDKRSTNKAQEDPVTNKMSDEQFYLLVEVLNKPLQQNTI